MNKDYVPNAEEIEATIQALKEILPDPKPSVPEDGEIVRAAKTLASKLWYDSHQAMVAFARAIEAENQARKEENEALRKLFRNHEERIQGIQTTKRRITKQINKIQGKVSTLERKIGELEEQLFHVTYGLEKKRVHKPPQDRAVDKNGHPLKPGVSVYSTSKYEQVLFFRLDPQHGWPTGFPIGRHTIAQTARSGDDQSSCTWLFDLPFPGGDA